MKQRSHDWLEARKSLLTASDFAAAVGWNDYCSRQKLFRLKKGIETFEGNEMTQWGTDNEHNGIFAYEAEMGVLVEETGLHIHRDYDWLGCSPDGLIELGCIEVKCPYSQAPYLEIPPRYIPQIIGVCEVMDREFIDFVCWTPYDLKVWRVYRDVDFWDEMLPHLDEFWSYVLRDEQPKRRKKPTMPDIKAELIYDTTEGM